MRHLFERWRWLGNSSTQPFSTRVAIVAPPQSFAVYPQSSNRSARSTFRSSGVTDISKPRCHSPRDYATGENSRVMAHALHKSARSTQALCHRSNATEAAHQETFCRGSELTELRSRDTAPFQTPMPREFSEGTRRLSTRRRFRLSRRRSWRGNGRSRNVNRRPRTAGPFPRTPTKNKEENDKYSDDAH